MAKRLISRLFSRIPESCKGRSTGSTTVRGVFAVTHGIVQTRRVAWFCAAAMTALSLASCGGTKKAKPVVTPTAPEPDPCTASKMDLVSMLAKAKCALPEGSEQPPTLDSKALDVRLGVQPASVVTGEKAELALWFINNGTAPLTLYFRVNPLPRFDVEVYDAKGKRIDPPAQDPPPPPKNYTAPPAPQDQIAKVTLLPGGKGWAAVPWEATKVRWAPEKLRGAAAGSGFPTTPAGPLPKGKYTVRVIPPILGLVEDADKPISAPKMEIEVLAK